MSSPTTAARQTQSLVQGPMQGKICLVTGATAGIGRATVAGLTDQGAHIVLIARNKAKGEQVMAEIRQKTPGAILDLLNADLSSQRSIRALADAYKAKYTRLDVLINNAGGVFSGRQTTEDGIELTWALNHLAYFLLTNLLLDVLKASAPARVVSVSSGAQQGGSIVFDNLQGEKSYSAFGAYSRSKLANVLFTYELARKLSGTGVTANVLHPGAIRSDFGMRTMTGPLKFAYRLIRPFMLTPEKGAETVVYLASAPEVATATGGYYENNKAVRSKNESYDEALARRLWDVSAQQTGLI